MEADVVFLFMTRPVGCKYKNALFKYCPRVFIIFFFLPRFFSVSQFLLESSLP